MKICFVVKSIYYQKPHYTTTHLAYEAFKRGHDVYYTTVSNFTLHDNQNISATTIKPEFADYPDRESFLLAHQSPLAKIEESLLSRFDVVFLRHNPFEFTATIDQTQGPTLEICRLLKQHGVKVVNDPEVLLLAGNKLYMEKFSSEIRAKTLISRSTQAIKDFLKDLDKPAIIKPLRGFGGQDVFFLKNLRDRNINQIIAAVSKNGYLVVQEYLPAVRYGDKRVLLLNGHPIIQNDKVALYSRLSPKGEIRSNIHIGGRRKKAEFSEMDRRLVEMIGPRLRSDGLYFVGVDIVGDRILEINVFCPGGIQSINDFYGMNVGQAVIEDLEKEIRQKKSE